MFVRFYYVRIDYIFQIFTVFIHFWNSFQVKITKTNFIESREKYYL